jgi:AraC-like DNA-binding protein
MFYLSHIPGPPLDAFVENIWFVNDTPAHAMERIIPSGTVELVINLREDEIRLYRSASSADSTRLSGAVVSGPYASYFVIDTRQHAAIMGVHFKPGRAHPFLGGLSVGELADSHVNLAEIWGPSARELRERLCRADTPAERTAIVECALLARLCRSPEGHGAVPLALHSLTTADAAVTVGRLPRRLGLSYRRFIEVFRAEVGMTPKLYARVQRFQRALATARTRPRADWARLALRWGYSDQSHLIRDFHAFCGFAPNQCLRQFAAPAKENHLPLIG